jgi:hypothetical protein
MLVLEQVCLTVAIARQVSYLGVVVEPPLPRYIFIITVDQSHSKLKQFVK